VSTIKNAYTCYREILYEKKNMFFVQNIWIPVLRSFCQSSLVRKALTSNQPINFPESSTPPFARSLDFDNPDDLVAVPAPPVFDQ
jgi:hypothetical protein